MSACFPACCRNISERCNHGKPRWSWFSCHTFQSQLVNKDTNVLQFSMSMMTKSENLKYPNHYGHVYFANDQINGLFLGRWVMLITAFPVNGKSKVKYTIECFVICTFISQPWVAFMSASFRYIFVLISEHLTEAERSTLPEKEAETRPCFSMVSDCIHHTAAGTEFSHASMLPDQKTTAINIYCVMKHTIQTFQNGV